MWDGPAVPYSPGYTGRPGGLEMTAAEGTEKC